MSEVDDGENEGIQRYHHQFTEQELNQMLYYWDEDADSVVEYHYLKRSWMEQGNETNNSSNNDDGEEDYVYLNLDTTSAAHVVEFYSPNCPHCHRLKEHYIDLADEMKYRAINPPIHFHAVSCGLYPMICRAYDIQEHPFVMGFAVGMPVDEPGVELNPHGDNTKLTEENIARALDVVLAPPDEDQSSKHMMLLNPQDNDLASRQAASSKISWHEYSFQTINDRYHNAGVTLASILHNVVQARQPHSPPAKKWLDPKREQALLEFLQLVDWASPVGWSVRQGLIEELLAKWEQATEDHVTFLDILKRHQSAQLFGNIYHEANRQGHSRKRRLGFSIRGLGMDVPIHMPEPIDASTPQHDKNISIHDANSQWTEACTHGQRGTGFSCGLWELLHIVSIGSSVPQRQLYGYVSGYWVAPQQVGLVIKNFLSHFFTCEVCRQHFIENYESCGQDHCHRLVSVVPVFASYSKPNDSRQHNEDASATSSDRALALWLFEFHNVVNLRLMNEAAIRQGRHVTREERLAAIFPTKRMCPACWLLHDTNSLQNDTIIASSFHPEESFAFLKQWYWPPSKEPDDSALMSSRARLGGNLELGDVTNLRFIHSARFLTWMPPLVTITSVVLLVTVMLLKSPRWWIGRMMITSWSTSGSQRKNL